MPRHIPRRSYSLAVVALSVALLASGTPTPHQVAAVSTISTTPAALSVTVALGDQVTKQITLSNDSAEALTPAIYEALPPAAAPASAHGKAGPRAATLPEQADRIDPQLLADFRAAPDRGADFLIYLHDQADLSAAYDIRDWAARGRFVYQTLVAHAEYTQRSLREQLVARGLAYRPLWIVNALVVHGVLADAQALAGRADVALIRANHTAALPPESDNTPASADRCSPDQPDNPICWNIRLIGADRVWHDFGVDGQGIVVANIDTGVHYDHPALTPRYRGYRGPGSYDHNYNWFDPQGTYVAPTDQNGHGTHTMGTMVATSDGTSNQPAVGVAPGARWIAAQGCDAYNCSEKDLLESAQWMLAPTDLFGARPRADLRAMVINNSWAGPGGNPWYAGYTAAWRAAGIFPVFAAGNAGVFVAQTCGSIYSPGDYPDVVGVGASDHLDGIAGFSLLGPSTQGQLKPDFVAPGTYQTGGQGVMSTYAVGGASYSTLQGTSMAAPHVAGLVALLWSANPALIGDYDATYAIIRDSAQPLSDTRCGDPAAAPNNVYGYGRIDAYAAVARARVDVPWLSAPATLQAVPANSAVDFPLTLDARRVPGPGVYQARVQIYGADLTQPPTTVAVTMNVTPAAQQATVAGRIVSAEGGGPLIGAVSVQDGPIVTTDSGGAYTVTLPLGSYTLNASARSFLPGQQALTVTGDLRAPDFALRPDQPRLVLATEALSASLTFQEHQQITVPIGNSGTQPLHYRVKVLPDWYAIWSSDEPGGPIYSWVDLPADAPRLHLGDHSYTDTIPLGLAFPFFEQIYTQTLAISDGSLAFDPPFDYRGPATRCLPASELPFSLIAPFRANLDPARGGAIRYGTLPGGHTFVLSYERVPLHSGLVEVPFSFQVLLHDDGRITFQYQALPAIPPDVSVGVQRSPADFEQVGCGATARLHDRMAIDLRPHEFPFTWMYSDVAVGQVLPGAQQTITLTLDWLRPNTTYPRRGRIELSSTDPLHSTVVLTMDATMLRAPYEQWLPETGDLTYPIPDP